MRRGGTPVKEEKNQDYPIMKNMHKQNERIKDMF